MEIKERFIDYIKYEKRLSLNTVETYGTSLRLFGEFLSTLPEPRTLETADSDNIREWLESLLERGRSAVYVNRSLIALRTFYKFCLTMNVVAVDPARLVVGPKKPKRLPTFLNEKDMQRLDDILKDKEHNFTNVRARTIIYMFYLTGMRVSELISLDDDSIDLVSGEIKVTGKRNKQRVIPYGEELKSLVLEYVKIRDAEVGNQEKALFVDEKGQRIKYEHVRKIVKGHLSLVSTNKKRTPHVLRHTFATAMLNNDANIESIRKLLGHQSLDATEIYTHTTFEQLRRVYNEAHPHS